MASNGTLRTLVLAALVLALLYLRLRRTFGRQRVSRARLILRAALLAFVGCSVLATLLGAFSPWRLAEALLGLVAGAAAALYGLGLTAFERTPEGAYYTPNRYVGLAVSALFLARLGYEILFGSLAGPGANGGAGIRQAYDPVTGTVLFLFVGYYVCYYLGVLRRSGEPARRGP